MEDGSGGSGADAPIVTVDGVVAIGEPGGGGGVAVHASGCGSAPPSCAARRGVSLQPFVVALGSAQEDHVSLGDGVSPPVTNAFAFFAIRAASCRPE